MDSLNDTISCAKEKRKSPIVRTITEIGNNYARLMLRRRLNRQRHEGPNWKPRITTVDSCVDLGGSRQHGEASNEVISWSTDHPCSLNADGDDLRRNSNPNLCRLANVTCKPRDKGQQEKSKHHAVAAIRKLLTNKNCPEGKITAKPC